MKKLFALLPLLAVLFTGCASDYTVLQSFDSVILTADQSNKIIGETITFSAKDNNGNDHTNEAVFYVDGQQIEGHTLTSSVVKTYQVTAKYDVITSSPLTVSFSDGSEVLFKKRMLIEDYTGTWCGWCTRVAYAIELVKAQTDAAVVVGIHRASSNPGNADYDPFNYDASELEATLSAVGYPKGYLNRKTRWTGPEPNHIDQAIGLTQGENPKLGLALTPTITNGNLALDVNVKFSKDFANLKLVVYVVENGITYEQHNYTTYYDGVDLIENYQHNHILRGCLTAIMGDGISNSETLTGHTFTRSFATSLPASVANAANVEFIAFVVDENGNAINVRSAASGDTQDFERL